jgi:type IV pilus assembly protein PilE
MDMRTLMHKKEKKCLVCFGLRMELGMTLIELMTVVMIIAVLATLIFPTFQQRILAARRGDAVTQLLRLKIQQENFRMENVGYAKTEQISMPTSEFYTFVVANVSAKTYMLTAKAKGRQMSDERCLIMQIDQSFNKTPIHCFL